MVTSGNYSMHVLELVRNNGVSENMAENSDKRTGNSTAFFMFDYFDVLYHRELTGDDKWYMNYFTIQDYFKNDKDYKVSYKTLSLYQHKERETSKPFRFKREKFSTNPFLGIIQISLCKECYENKEISNINIDEFLTDCENKILELVDGAINKNKIIKQMYRSSTTGDFCLVLRTDSVNKIYKIALLLNDTQNHPQKGLKLLTYTSVGLKSQLNIDKNGNYVSFDQKFINEHQDMKFALRFSADQKLENHLIKYLKEKEAAGDKLLESLKGLFGRYDYLLNISLEEFAHIYPMLCEKKLGMDLKPAIEYNENSMDLKEILYYSDIRNINERILVELQQLENSQEVYPLSTKEKRKNPILTTNEILYKEIKKLERYRCFFQKEHRAFQDLYRGTLEIYKSFSPVGMEKDAYVNWRIFHRDMRILCGCIENRLKYCKSNKISEIDKEIIRENILKNWRVNLQAINQYTRLVQNVNYQTYQSPIYEIQTQIDTEKAMVAYREAMEHHMTVYAQKEKNKKEDVIYPIIYPDLAVDKVEIQAPFSDEKKGDVEREIVCTVPSFEYFGRLYDLLPWILHETSHHIRVTDRKLRNEFITKYVFQNVFEKVMYDILQEIGNLRKSRGLGKIEIQLIECMVQEAAKIFMNKKDDVSKKKVDNFNFEQIVHALGVYLDGLFPNDSVSMLGRKEMSEKEARDSLRDMLLNECRKENLLDSDKIERFKDMEMKKQVVSNAERLIESLLLCYKEKVCESLKGEGEEEVFKRKQPDEWYNLKDMQKPLIWIEDKMYRMLEPFNGEKNINEKVKNIFREYFCSVKCVYEKYVEYKGGRWLPVESSKDIKEFLEKVFDAYRQKWKSAEIQDMYISLLIDPRTSHFLDDIGLLNGDKKLFCARMMQYFQRMDGNKIQRYKIFCTVTYREACADLLMAVSLQMDSFGYCRQVFRTISDAKTEKREYSYEDLNYERFRIITAVLLADEGAHCESESGGSEIKIDGKNLINKGVKYLKYNLKYLNEILPKEAKKSGLSFGNKKIELLGEFLGDIYCTLSDKIGSLDEKTYRRTILYAFLHKDKQYLCVEAQEKMIKYESIKSVCVIHEEILWRIECFCLGISKILQDKCVLVSKFFFEHMSRDMLKVLKQEKDSADALNYLVHFSKPTDAVGRFYNDPRQVFYASTEMKLKNTIDFIQNYYYYNRFRITKEAKEEDEEREKNCSGEVCG